MQGQGRASSDLGKPEMMGTSTSARITTEFALPRNSQWVPAVQILTDTVALQLSFALGYLSRVLMSGVYPVALGPSQYQGLALSMLLLPLGYGMAGLYPGYGLTPVERLRRRTHATLLMFIVLIGWEWLVGRAGWSRGILIGTVLWALIIPPLFDAALREILIQTRYWGMPVAVLGAGKTGSLVLERLRQTPSLGLVPVVVLDDDPKRQGFRLGGLPVAGPLSIASMFVEQGVHTAILAMPGVHRTRVLRILDKLPFSRVILVPDLFGVPSLWNASRDLGGIIGVEVPRNLLDPRNQFLKRLMDYVLAIPLAIATSPIILILGMLIKLVSPGPAFYVQEREGLRGRPIRVWKLRTMYQDAESRLEQHLQHDPTARAEWESHFKLKNDPRIIPVIGQLLRKTSLDELPQLWNVIRGDMSLVGPRPFPSYHLEKFSQEFRSLRHSVRPGITGLWQVSERSDGNLEVQEYLDTYYICNWSLWLDLYILARTVWAIIRPRGAY